MSYDEMKSKVEKIRRDVAKAEGAMDQLTKTLKDEFNCTSLKEAEAYLAELETEITTLQTEFDDMLQSFSEKWKSVIND